ncbi:hypothetical protein EDF56_101871 [Novosphingobium sp. PhB165]|uniref:DUF1178 family protein n=1 Tax=Novosphingobium sp. PhB165 TaxID=2485105 RepID=UPI00104D336D|nr:DUF1178 family protein [Novosphingobium sp. PhB165]TCM22188.1 hypothetical protein EDF56_101871 [Novosphingobium sp. PhB165]
MIVYDLECRGARHRFEGWFKSSDDFVRQQQGGLLCCPQCGTGDVSKALQAPRLARKGNQRSDPVPSSRAVSKPEPHPVAPRETPVASAPLPPQAVELIRKLAKMQSEALKDSRYVGKSFVDDARAMHYGEREAEVIHGEASVEQAQELIEEGIAVAPLPFAVVPPEQAN